MSDLKTMTIKTEHLTIGQALERNLYEIPNFQRPYSWEEEQLREYWDDINGSKTDLFLGSVVTWVANEDKLFKNKLAIIDGQQRYTTTIIILSVLRDYFHQINIDHGGNDRVAIVGKESVHEYIITKNKRGVEYPTLAREETVYQNDIQILTEIPAKVTKHFSNKRIQEARHFFYDKVGELIQGLSKDDVINELYRLFEKVTLAQIVLITLLSEEDAFLIFETLNTRGADLQLADLIKNLLIREGSQDEAGRRNLTVRWEELVCKLEVKEEDYSIVDSFLWQSWNSRNKYTTTKDIYKVIKNDLMSCSSVNSENVYESYLANLESDIDIFVNFGNKELQVSERARATNKAFKVPEFVDSLRALSLFDIKVANSFVMAIARKFNKGDMDESHLKELIRLVECFHFQFNAITQSGSRGGNRSRWNSYAIKIDQAKSRSEIRALTDELRMKLIESLPPRNIVVDKFKDLFYAPEVKINNSAKPTSSRLFISYVLISFMKYKKQRASGELPTLLSIEHLIPLSDAKKKLDAKRIHSIGNLILITKELNGLLGDADLPEKFDILRENYSPSDDVFAKWLEEGKNSQTVKDGLTIDEIQERAIGLANMAVDCVWSLEKPK